MNGVDPAYQSLPGGGLTKKLEKEMDKKIAEALEGVSAKSAYQSYVDTTTDSPPKTEAEWVASLKGADGVDLGEVAIADNLTTDDARKVLSAKQGYELGKKVGQIDNALQSQYYSEDVDLDSLTSLNGAIVSSGNWGTSLASKHRNLPVIAGERYMITASDNLKCEYAFFVTEYFERQKTPDYVSGTSFTRIDAGAQKEITIPDGCNYLYLLETTSSGNVPTYGYLPSSVIRITTFGDRYTEIQEIIENSYRKIEIESFTIKDGSLRTDGTFGSASYKHGVISVNEGERFILKNTGDTDNVRYAFATSDASSTQGNIPLVVGTNVIIVNAQREVYIVIPRGCSHLLWNCSPSYNATLYRYKMEDWGSPSDSSIFALNPDSDMKQKMVLIKKKTDNGASGSSTIPPLCFAHISDVHAGAEQMARYIEFANYWKQKGYIDELIDTGDVVSNTWSQGTAWRDSINGIEKVITVVGNHDTRASTDEIAATGYPTGQNQWQYHSAISLDPDKRKDAYNLLMVGPDVSNPYINSWEVTQPADAAANGLCYYYKDYANSHIRVIGIDAMGYDAAQDNWLRARLQETLDASNAAYGYHVVILTHFTGGQMVGLTCNYTSLRNTGIDYGSNYNADLSLMPISVNSFQSDGGIFVGYVIGHYHRDMINILQDYPKQLAFAVSSGGKTVLRDFTKVSGCKSYDDFQLISVNTYDYTVRLLKVGADTDYYMRKKGTVCVSYSLVKEDGKEPDAGETATKVKGVLGEGW